MPNAASTPSDDGGFDLSSAQPVASSADDGGFDLANAVPVSTAGSDIPFQDSWGSTLKHAAGLTARAAADAVTALPLLAMDAGVASRNIIGDEYHKVTGAPATADYDLPSAMWRQSEDQIFPTPQNAAEKVTSAIAPIVLGGMSAAESAPAVLRSAAGIPEVANPAPQGFMNLADQKRQLLARTIQNGQKLGLVAPPQTTNPNALNATVETIGGKIATQQAASVHNQPIANAVAASELGLNRGAPLTVGAVRGVIKDAGSGYEALRNVGQINSDDQYLDTLSDVAARAAGPAASFAGSKESPLISEVDSLLQPSFDSSDAVDKIAELRDSSSMAYRAGDTRMGAGYRQLSNALENQIDRGISQNPNVAPDTVANFRASRALAAKAHSVLDALNPATGDVSIQSLANSEDPLSGNLKVLADFGKAVPRATQDVSKIGSHGVSHLDTLGTLLTGAVGEHAAGPAGMAAAAAYPVARWGARAYALGPGQSAALPAIATQTGSPKTAAAALQAGNQLLGSSPNDMTTRASGGKVDHEALVSRLMTRWHQARKAGKDVTKPLLQVPDATITRALDIAQAHL